MSQGDSTKTIGYISFDWEARGPHMKKHGFNGFGAVLFNKDGQVVRDVGFGIQADVWQALDPDTKTTFWDKNPAALRWCETNPLAPQEAAQQIVRFYLQAKAEFKTVQWIAWPAAYDWANLMFFLTEFHPETSPIKEHKAECVSSMALAYQLAAGLPKKPDLAALGIHNANAHNPVSDALAQGQAFFVLREKLTALAKKESATLPSPNT